jgi:hypothetical protein
MSASQSRAVRKLVRKPPRRAIAKAQDVLREFPALSDPEIARKAKVTTATAKKARALLNAQMH